MGKLDRDEDGLFKDHDMRIRQLAWMDKERRRSWQNEPWSESEETLVIQSTLSSSFKEPESDPLKKEVRIQGELISRLQSTVALLSKKEKRTHGNY